MRAALAAMLCFGCARHDAPAAPQGPRKPRVEITVWLDHTPEGDADTAVQISTKAPPKAREMLSRGGLQLAILGVPKDGDAQAFLEKAVPEADAAGSIGTILVSTRCAADLAAAIEKKIYFYWRVPLAIGAACETKVKPAVGSVMLVEAGSISRARITFDRHTQAILKVEPIR